MVVLDQFGLAMNPYSNRLPVTKPQQFYGRRHQTLQIAQKLRNDEIACISGEPRIGRTSLLYYLAHPAGAQSMPEFISLIDHSEQYLFVLVELQRLPVRRVNEFWRYVFDRLAEEVRKSPDRESRPMKECYQRSQETLDDYQIRSSFVTYLKLMAECKVVLLFDDFDTLIVTFDADEVIQVTDALKTLQSSLDLAGKLNYVIATVDPLPRLYKMRNIASPSRLGTTSAPLDPLGLLEPEAVEKLIYQPLQQVEPQTVTFTSNDLAFIHYLAGRHPDLIKIVCFYLYQARSQGEVDYQNVQQSIETDASVGWLMSGLWERIKRGEQIEALPLSAALHSIAYSQGSIDRRTFTDLWMRGLVEGSFSSPQLFGDLFCRFVRGVQPQAEMAISKPPSLSLTPLESKLYQYLAAHVERTCTREDLQKALWGANLPASRDALEQVVKRLREKIEPNPKQPSYLLNARGHGYFLRREGVRGEYL